MPLRDCAVRVLVLALGIAGAAAMAQESPAAAQPCTIRATTFDGWPAQEMQNSWVQLIFVPELGGRLMQVTFNGHPYLFVNPQWEGKYIPPDQARGRWINYGGDKIWPLPEGDGITNDEQHWNGGSTPLDDGAYAFSIVSQGKQCSVRLDGPPDPTVGLQYSRIITIGPDSPEISFHAITRNYTGHSVDWSVQSVTQYSLAAPDQPNGYNHDFWGITPVNPHSAYLLGYHARNGLANDPSYSVKDGLFRDHWKYVEGEVWIDSPAGWLVTVDGPTNFAMVEKTRHIDNAEYPGKASIIFYKSGPSARLDSQGMPHYTETKAPYYMEAEVNSPIAHLETGQVYTFDTHWFPCRMGANFRTTVEAGVIGNPLQAIRNRDNIELTGQFGVFYPGHLEARLYNRGGTLLSQVNLQSASPSDLINLSKTVEGARVTLVSVHLIDTHDVDRGALGEELVTGGNGGAF